MAFGIEHFIEREWGRAVRRVLDPLAPLVLHDVALSVHGLRRHRVEKVPETVGLEKERQLQGVRRHVDEVVRGVVAGGRVVGAASLLEPLIELPVLHVAGSHEHQVLEEMREAGAPRVLARRADVVPDVHGDNRRAVILVQNHGHAVGQRELRVPRFSAAGAGGCAGDCAADCAGDRDGDSAAGCAPADAAVSTATARHVETVDLMATILVRPNSQFLISSRFVFKYPDGRTDRASARGHHHGQQVRLGDMRQAGEILTTFGVSHEARVLSAHRSPALTADTPRRRPGAASKSSSRGPAAPRIWPASWPRTQSCR